MGPKGKKHMTAIVRLGAFASAFLLLSTPAYAYLDPVTGSLLVQGLVALVAGIVAGVKSVRRRIVRVLGALVGRKDA